MDVPVNKVKEFETEFISFMHQKHQDVLDALAAGKLTDEIKNTLETVAADLSKNTQHNNGELKRNTRPYLFCWFNHADYQCYENGIGQKLKRAQDAITQMRPYATKLRDLLINLSSTLEGSDGGAFCSRTRSKKSVIGSDYFQ